MDTVNVLVLYGGEKATAPRDMLIEWLNSNDFHDEIGKTIVAKKVAAMIAHNEDSIDLRVEKMMDWADKAIFLLTPDDRSKFGAPNVLEEFGRWIGQKSRRTMLTLRHKEVEVHSNASGLVYVGFEKDHDVIIKCRNRIVAFINEVIPPEENSGEPEAANAIVDNSTHYGDNATVGDNNTSFNTGSVGGNLTGRDSIGGNVIHVAGDYHAGGESPKKTKDNGPLLEEKIRLDAWYPGAGVVSAPIKILVAVLQRNAPKFNIDYLMKNSTADGVAYLNNNKELINYKIEITCPGCLVEPKSKQVSLRSGENSPVVSFFITADKPGIKHVMITAYQDSEIFAAETLIEVNVDVEVIEKNQKSNDINKSQEIIEISLPNLREFLSNKYGKEDLNFVIQQMDKGIDKDDFGSSKMGLILDLLPYLQRRDLLNDFLEILAKDPRLGKKFGDANKYILLEN